MALGALALLGQPKVTAEKEAAMKADLAGQIDAMKKQAQVMVDSVFSFGELGFQEFETSKYLTGILEKEGFKIERGVAGIPTAWVATWGSGKPVISLGSRYRRHSAGLAEARRRLARADDRRRAGPRRRPQLRRAAEHHRGARGEESDGARASARARSSCGPASPKNWSAPRPTTCAPACSRMWTSACSRTSPTTWAFPGARRSNQNGLVSVEYMFKGESAHAAGAPWRGKSALDAVELMDVGWNFRREHLRLAQRSHYVITNGGDQPNVVPPTAARLVLLPRGRLRPHHGHVAHRRQHGARPRR